MAASQALEALAAAARSSRGHEPWVFYPRDGRWRWWSFARGWTEVERWRAALDRGERPSVDQAPAPQSSPQALCCHLAAAPAETLSAGVFDRFLAPREPAREIVVVTPPPAGPPTGVDRLSLPWLHWCCRNLAALVLEPSREALIGSVLWCRPTVLLASMAEESALAAAVRERSRDRERRAAALLDRLRVLLVAVEDQESLGEAVEPAAFWRAWGVERRLVCPGDPDRR